MSHHFSADEIFEMAKQIEVNGAKFYRAAADNVSGDKEKAFLKALAVMEDKHEKTFEELHQHFKSDSSEAMFDPDGEAVRYLKSIADTKIFFKKDPPADNMENIIHSAIRAEQDSIVFYLGMCEMVSDELGKSHVDGIIKEEMDHIRILSNKAAEMGL